MYEYDGDMYLMVENQANMLTDWQNAVKSDQERLEAKKNKKPTSPLESAAFDKNKFT